MLIVLVIATLLSVLITPLVICFYKKNNWLDDPTKKSFVKTTHQETVPRGGGLVVFFSVLASSVIFLKFDKYLIAIFLSALILTIIGFLDDIFDLDPRLRFVTNALASLIIVGAGVGIAYISNPFANGVIHLDQPQITFTLFNKSRSIWILADLFAFLFIIWNINIVNWAKGVDGQLPGFVAIALIFIGLLSQRFVDDPTAFHTGQLSFIIAGSFLGLLFWNWYPQKIMPGYGAGSLAGFFLSVLAILSGAKVATTLMVLALPTADGIFTISRRILAGKSPFWGDRGHLHHKLMDVFGWGRRRIAVFYWFWSLGMGALSLFLNSLGKLSAILITIFFVFIMQVYLKRQSATMQNKKSGV